MSSRIRVLNAALCWLALGGTAALAADGYECRQADLVRQVEVQYLTPGQAVPCQVEYRKPSEGVDSQILWSAEREQGYCEFKAKEFRSKLESWGWSCGAPAASKEETVEPDQDPQRMEN